MFREGRHGGKDEGAIVVLDTKYIRALFVFVWLTMKEAQTRPLKPINRITFSRHGNSNRPFTGTGGVRVHKTTASQLNLIN